MNKKILLLQIIKDKEKNKKNTPSIAIKAILGYMTFVLENKKLVETLAVTKTTATVVELWV